MKRKTEREKFEAAFQEWDPKSLRARYDDGYCSSWLDGAWVGWQAAKRQAARERKR